MTSIRAADLAAEVMFRRKEGGNERMNADTPQRIDVFPTSFSIKIFWAYAL
jgi:hypothetical protein